MRNLHVVVGSILIGISTASCGIFKKDKDDEVSNTPAQNNGGVNGQTGGQTETSFEGVWSGDCEKGSSSYQKSQLNFSGSQVAIGSMNSENSDCSAPSLRYEILFNFTSSDASERAGLKKLTMIYTKQRMTALAESMATLLNLTSYCGISDWKKDVARDVDASMPNCVKQQSYKKGEALAEVVGSELKIYDVQDANTPSNVYKK